MVARARFQDRIDDSLFSRCGSGYVKSQLYHLESIWIIIGHIDSKPGRYISHCKVIQTYTNQHPSRKRTESPDSAALMIYNE